MTQDTKTYITFDILDDPFGFLGLFGMQEERIVIDVECEEVTDENE